jgi:hypothetical protein
VSSRARGITDDEESDARKRAAIKGTTPLKRPEEPWLLSLLSFWTASVSPRAGVTQYRIALRANHRSSAHYV